MKRRRVEPFAPYRAVVRSKARRRLLAPPRTGGFRGQTAPFRRITAERKVIDTDTANYACNTTGAVTLVNGVAIGSDYTDRVGRKIRLKSIYVRGLVTRNFSNLPGPLYADLARMLIVFDTQTNGVAPVITDILKEANASSQLNLNNRDRFKVLIDKQYSIAPYIIQDTATQSYALAGSPTTHHIKKYKKLNHEVVFNGTQATVGSISTGAIWMLWVGSNASDATDPVATVSVRIRFEDA